MSNCAVVGVNWGDEGKGRMIDLLAEKYDIVIGIRAAATPGIPWLIDTGNSRST